MRASSAPAAPPLSAAPQIRLLHAIFALLERLGVPYCVLHGYQGFAHGVSTDVDCILPAWALPARLAMILEDHRVDIGGRLVQWLQHESTAHYFVLTADGAGPSPHFLALDASSDYRRDGRVFYRGEELLSSRRRAGPLWVPAPALEFGCYLIKKVAKRALAPEHGRRLTELYRQDPEGCTREVARFWTGDAAALIADGARRQRWDRVREQLPWLRERLLRPRGASAVPAALRYWAGDAARRIHRWLAPTGVHVVLLGPDGAGKSSTLSALGVSLAPAFRRVAQHHLAPALLPRRAAAPVDRPHRLPPRGRLGSLAKAAYWAVEYTLGYALRIRPALARSTLVLFDRYLLDALVDPRRYRYGGPPNLLLLLWDAVPQPDLVILLDAPPEVLQARKCEVVYEETVRQREAYRALVVRLPYGRLVDGAQPLDGVVADATGVVLDFMAARTSERLCGRTVA